MTSKDKLIEFLKSAEIEYRTEQDYKDKCNIEGQSWIVTDIIEFYFKLDGSFESMNDTNG